MSNPAKIKKKHNKMVKTAIKQNNLILSSESFNFFQLCM